MFAGVGGLRFESPVHFFHNERRFD